MCNLCFHFKLSASFFFIVSLFFGLSQSLCVSLSKLPWSLPQCHRNIICLCLAIHLLGFFSSFRSNLGSLTSCATQFHSFSLEIAFMKFFVYCLCCECLHIISFDVIAVSGRSTKQYTIKQTISRQQWMLRRTFSRIHIEFIPTRAKNCLLANSQEDNFKKMICSTLYTHFLLSIAESV